MPNFFIEKFRIPPFLLPIYQAAGIQYGVRWEVLAAINEIETDYGRNLNVSSAGAVGWMQFMPSTWKLYGVDANKDGYKDPNNPADAIFAAARYLRAAGAAQDLHKAIFAYNHAEWYVDSVLLRARVIGGLPAGLVGSLTGLTQGRFPVLADATYANSVSKQQLRKQGKKAPAYEIRSNARRNGIKIFARQGAPVVAVNDGKVVRIGRSKRLGRFVTIQDVYGNVYTYGRLKKVARVYPTPKPTQGQRAGRPARAQPRPDVEGSQADSARFEDHRGDGPGAQERREGRQARGRRPREGRQASARPPRPSARRSPSSGCSPTRRGPRRARPAATSRSSRAPAGSRATRASRTTSSAPSGSTARTSRSRSCAPARRSPPGTILGRIGRTTSSQAPHVLFEIRPAGRGAPRIDPKPILDGWKLLESTAIYRAAGKNPFFGAGRQEPVDRPDPADEQGRRSSARVLADPRIQIYDCGRHDVQTGQIDRRVLATLEFLSASGFKPTVTSLKCGHSFLTTSGNVSEHTTGTAVDIAAVNGIPIVGNQGKGSITELVIQRLLTLQGTMKPHQIISLMTFDGTDNTFAMADHNDHIHVGWRPLYGANSKLSKQVDQVLRPGQWIKLIDRLGDIDNPVVREQPSKYAVKSVERGVGLPPRGVTEQPPAAGRFFTFVQWEFAGRLGPDAGPLRRAPLRRRRGAPRAGDRDRRGAAARALRPRARPPRASPEPRRST